MSDTHGNEQEDQKYDVDSQDANDQGSFSIEEEIRFERICLNLINCQNWSDLHQVCKAHLQMKHTSSWKAFFYYGVSMFKQNKYEIAIAAFESAERVNSEDAQLHYNLGLAQFKIGNYSLSVEHFKKCIMHDNKHPFAYNNLAFLFNMHMIYKETLNICR